MLNRVRNLSNVVRINHLIYGNIPTRCGREKCYCLMKLDLKDDKDKKYYNNCYDGWYNFHMKNKLEIQ